MEFLAGIGLVWLAIWGALFIAALVCAEYETPGIFTLVLGVAFCWLPSPRLPAPISWPVWYGTASARVRPSARSFRVVRA